MRDLYLVDKEFEELIDENGEITDLDRFGQLMEERENCISNIANVIKNLQCESDAIEAEEKRLKTLKESNRVKTERLMQLLRGALNEENYSNGVVKVQFRTTSRIVIDNKEDVPKSYWVTKITEEPSKDLIKQAIENGESVQGAHKETYKSMSIK